MAQAQAVSSFDASTAAAAATGVAPTGGWGLFYRGAAVAFGVFAIWSAGPGIAEDHLHLGVFTLVMWVLAFLRYPTVKTETWQTPDLFDIANAAILVSAVGASVLRAEQVAEAGSGGLDWALWGIAAAAAALVVRRPKSLDLALIGLAALCLGYYLVEYLELVDRAGAWNWTDVLMAGMAVLLALEAARRGIGPWIPGIALFALFFAYAGSIFPDAVAHRGASLQQIVNYSFYSQEGIFGVMTTVMANYVLIFIYLGAFMQHSGMGRFFIDLPMALAGRSAGGPAKVAVAASAVFGSISGSSLANVVSTGNLTIPLMKSVGFRPHVAGAVENSSSLGGQLLPPVMGSGVFIMAEITGIPYVEIIAVAAVPALLYLFSIWLIVHFEARKHGIEGVAEGEALPALTVLRGGWFHILPFAVLLSFLIAGYSPDWCAVMAILCTVVINWIRVALARLGMTAMPQEVMGPRTLVRAFVDGTTNALGIGAAAAGVGLIIGMMAMTGVGLKLGLLMVQVSDGNLLIALVLVALASLVLGMALPITASYLVLVVIAGPALQELGVALIAAHLIVFWLSQDSNITPPVCLGAFVAASIAKADPWQTAWASFRFAKMLYVMPVLFAFTPILMTGGTAEGLWAMAAATVGTVAFSAWTVGYFRTRLARLQWALLMAAALLCFWPAQEVALPVLNGMIVNLLGAAALVAVFLWQRQRPTEASPATDEK